MGLTPEKKAQILADMLFKQIAAGKAASTSQTAFFEELVNAAQMVFPSQLIAQENEIPFSAKEVPGVVEKITDLPLIPVPGTNAKAFYHPDLTRVIPFNFGDGSSYLYQLKKSDLSAIPFGQNDWFFNPAAGVLYFMDGFPQGVSQKQPPLISCYRYTGKKGSSSNDLPQLHTEVFIPTKGQKQFFLKIIPRQVHYLALNGVVQQPINDYTLKDRTLTWNNTIPLDNNDTLHIQYY